MLYRLRILKDRGFARLNLSILYTANIRGDLELLPRLHTFIKSLNQDIARFRPEDEADVMLCAVQPPSVRTLLLDLGDSCADDVWHCAATGGRSTLIALDAMGYHAANVNGILSAEGRAKLTDNVMGMALVDGEHVWTDGDLVITHADGEVLSATNPYNLHIVLAPANRTRLALNTLNLGGVERGQVGTAYIGGMNSDPTLLADAIFDLPSSALPDPTISAAVQFVTNEARRYVRKGG
jgi:hypothetical protein